MAGGAIGRGLQGLGQGVGDVGQALAAIEQKKQKIRNDAAEADAVKSENDFVLGKQQELRGRTYANVNEAQTDREQVRQELEQLRANQASKMSEEAFGRYNNASKRNEAIRLRSFEGIIYKKEIELGQATASAGLKSANNVLLNPASTPQEMEIAQGTIESIEEGFAQYFPPGGLDRLKVESQVAAHKQLGTQGDLVQFEAAREAIQKAPDFVFTAEEELAELRNIDILENRTKAKTEDLKFERDMAINEDFVQKIMTKNLDPDEIQSSRLDEGDKFGGIGEFGEITKNRWHQYNAASVDGLPLNPTPEGASKALETVIKHGKNRLNKENAYRELLDNRYIDKSITDEDFQRALNRIDNPYPRQTINDIEIVTDSVDISVAGSGFFDRLRFSDAERKQAAEVNSELLYWIDSEFKENRVPTQKEIFTKSKELISGTPQEPEPSKEEDISSLSDKELLKRITQ